MPLSETNTDDFVTYSQELREAKDDYTARKVQKDRHKHIHWLNTVTESREVMIEYINQENEKIRRVATRVGFENYEWDNVPEVIPRFNFFLQNKINQLKTESLEFINITAVQKASSDLNTKIGELHRITN